MPDTDVLDRLERTAVRTDDDVVDRSNLQRQILHHTSAVGRPTGAGPFPTGDTTVNRRRLAT